MAAGLGIDRWITLLPYASMAWISFCSSRTKNSAALKEGYVFRKLNARATVFIEYAPLETAWVPIVGDNYYYVYCLRVSGSPKGSGYGKTLMEHCLADAKAKELPCVFNNWAVFYKGNFETVNLLDVAYLQRILKIGNGMRKAGAVESNSQNRQQRMENCNLV